MSSLSAINTADLPYHKLEVKSSSATIDPYQCPPRIDNQIFYHPRQGFYILPVKRENIILLLLVIEEGLG